jgi:misacylated tRNA(Ala) deacylase
VGSFSRNIWRRSEGRALAQTRNLLWPLMMPHGGRRRSTCRTAYQRRSEGANICIPELSFADAMITTLLFRDNAYSRTASARVLAVDEFGIELDRTIFYPLGGGQSGDTGALLRADGERIPILDTRKGDTIDSVRHVPAPGMPRPEIGETLTLEIDWERRYSLMRLHTALHVMSCVVVAPVSGGNISPDKGRLDFDIDMSLLDAERIERETNALIARGVETETVWISDEELDARPELVKTMSVQPPRGAGRVRLLKIPGIDLQPCGGTHVKNIAEIGGIRVLKVRSEGKRNKRVEIALARNSELE